MKNKIFFLTLPVLMFAMNFLRMEGIDYEKGIFRKNSRHEAWPACLKMASDFNMKAVGNEGDMCYLKFLKVVPLGGLFNFLRLVKKAGINENAADDSKKAASETFLKRYPYLAAGLNANGAKLKEDAENLEKCLAGLSLSKIENKEMDYPEKTYEPGDDAWGACSQICGKYEQANRNFVGNDGEDKCMCGIVPPVQALQDFLLVVNSILKSSKKDARILLWNALLLRYPHIAAGLYFDSDNLQNDIIKLDY